MDKETALAPHAPLPQKEPKVQPKFQVPPIPQPGFFPSITLEACIAYAKFWYAQAQVQALAGQGQYLMPASAIVAQPRA